MLHFHELRLLIFFLPSRKINYAILDELPLELKPLVVLLHLLLREMFAELYPQICSDRLKLCQEWTSVPATKNGRGSRCDRFANFLE